MTIQCNKHGIPVITTKKNQRKVKSINHLNHKEFAEFVRFVDGIEIKVTVLNFKPVINAMKSDGWILKQYSDGEIV